MKMEEADSVRGAKRARTDAIRDVSSTHIDLSSRMEALKQEEKALTREAKAIERQLAAKRGELDAVRGEMGRLLVGMLPIDLWGDILSYLAFEDGLKQCTSVNKYFALSVAPQIRHPVGFTLKIRVTSDLVLMSPVRKNPMWSAFLSPRQQRPLDLLARFRNVQSIQIMECMQHTINPDLLSMVLCCFPSLLRLTLVGLDSKKGYLSSNDEYYNDFATKLLPMDFACISSHIESSSDLGGTKELREAFKTVGSSLEHLSLENCYLTPPLAIMALSGLERLSKLKICMNEEMYQARDDNSEQIIEHRSNDDVRKLGEVIGECLECALPLLKELVISPSKCEDDDSRDVYVDNSFFYDGLMTVCARLKNLRVLHALFLCWRENDSHGLALERKFAQMLVSANSLEEIGPLRYPCVEFWDELLKSNKTVGLKKLSIYYCEEYKDVFESSVRALIKRFLLLEELQLDLSDQARGYDPDIVDYSTALQISGRLKHHTSLKKIRLKIGSCDPVSEEEECAYRAGLEQYIGDQIQVEKMVRSLEEDPE